MLTRFQPGHPEDPQHSQAAVRALISAGYAPDDAGRAFVEYRSRLREAIAGWPAIAIAGFLTSLIPAILLAFLGATSIAVLLCALGVGLGVIERWRWRREYVLGEFKVGTADRQYLLHQGGLWAVLLSALALPEFRQAGAVVGLGIFFGLPLSFVYRYYFYRTYPKVLAIVSNAPAGAQAHSIIKREIASSGTTRIETIRRLWRS